MHYITGSLALNPVHSKVDKTGQTVPGKGLNRLWMFGVLLLVAFGKCFYRFSCLQILQGNGGIEQACISICCTFLLISFDSLRAIAKAKHADAVLFLRAFHSQLLMWHNFAGVYRLTFKSFYEERSRWGHKSTFILHLWIETLSPQGGIVCKSSCKLQAHESCMEPR